MRAVADSSWPSPVTKIIPYVAPHLVRDGRNLFVFPIHHNVVYMMKAGGYSPVGEHVDTNRHAELGRLCPGMWSCFPQERYSVITLAVTNSPWTIQSFPLAFPTFLIKRELIHTFSIKYTNLLFIILSLRSPVPQTLLADTILGK